MDKQKLAEKILSGRFILTCLAGATFAYVACNKIIEVAATTAILSNIFTSYFGRQRKPEQ